MQKLRGVILFDLGEVLATPTHLYEQLAAAAGVGIDDIKRAYWSPRDAYDRGASPELYWGGVTRELGLADPGEAMIGRLSDIDSAAWSSIRGDARNLLAEVRETGIRVGVLSNAPVALARAARQSDWAHLVQEWFFSGELGVAKPDPAIYQLVARQLDVPEAKTYFFDDRHANVAAARDAGWNAFLWSTVAAARADLEELGVL